MTEPKDDLLRLFDARKRSDIDCLERALTDPEHRFMAATFLRELDADKAVPQIARLLDTRDFHARIAAVRALGKFKATQFVPRLISLAREDDSDVVREWTVVALAEIGEADALPVIRETLQSSSWRLRRSAIRALEIIGGGDESIQALENARRRDRWSRCRTYRRAIRKLRGEEA